MAFVIPLGNILETFLAYVLFRRICPHFDLSFRSVRDLALFLLACPWLPALTSGLISQTILQLVGSIPPNRFFVEVAVYSLGNATGILLVTPLALVWKDLPFYRWKTAHGLMLIGQLALVFFALWLFYGSQAPSWGRLAAVAIIPMVAFAIWSTGIRGATLVCLAISISYFAFDVPGARPLSSLLEEKQKSAAVRFVLENKLSENQTEQYPPRIAREIADQIGMLALICITLLPLGMAADELRQKSLRDQLAMSALRSSFWNWTQAGGYQIENQDIGRLFLPWVRLFLPERENGSLKITAPENSSSIFVSQWVCQKRDHAGNPLEVSGILRNISAEEERDEAVAQMRLRELEIQVLRSHLNPHLLFNCLTGLRGLIAENPDRARDFAGSLARFLRAVVDSEKERTIPLSRELEICEDFVHLETLRGRPTNLQIQVNEHDRSVGIPPMTLVTLVENAGKHGAREGRHALTVDISASRAFSGQIQIRVTQPGSLQTSNGDRNQAGLDLIRRQLNAVFGSESAFNIGEETRGLTTVTLRVPA